MFYIVALSTATIAIHLNYLFLQDPEYLNKVQMKRHLNIMEGVAAAPYQYRILSELIVEAGLIFCKKLLKFKFESIYVFIFLRSIYVYISLILIYYYYHLLGLSKSYIIVGIGFVISAMSWAFYNSDLSLNIYLDLIFYTLSMIFIISRYDYLIIITSLLGVLNRETALLIPFLFLIVRLKERGVTSVFSFNFITLLPIFSSILSFMLVRYIYGERSMATPGGVNQGFDLFFYNLTQPKSWVYLLLFLNVVPILIIIKSQKYKSMPTTLRVTSQVMLPIWMVVHVFFGVVAETRLFLVPFSIVLVPIAMLSIQKDN